MAMNAASIRSLIQSRLTEPLKRDLSTDDLNLKLTALTKLDDAVLKVAADIDAKQKDNSLSHDGQQKAIAVIGTKAVPTFDWLARMRDAAVNEYDQKTHHMIDPLTAVPKGRDAVVDFLGLQEIRNAIGKTEAGLRFLKACETDDLESARALLSAPGAPWVPADLRHRGEVAFAQRAQPGLYAQRASVEVLRDELTMLVGVIASWLLSLGADKAVVHATLKG